MRDCDNNSLLTKLLLQFFLLFILSSCATFSQIFSSKDLVEINDINNESTANNKFRMIGKFVIFIEDKGFSGSLSWDSDKKRDNIQIFSPFNSLLATIKLNNITNDVVFEITDMRHEQNTQVFLKKIFVEENNIFRLKEAMINPPKELKSKNKADFYINQWSISLEDLYDNKNIPKIIKIQKNKVSLKLLVKKWIN